MKNNSSNEITKAKEDFTQLIKNELPVETYLQIANEYLSVGLYEEAQSIVQLCPPNNLVSYYEAYILHLRGMPYLPSLQKPILYFIISSIHEPLNSLNHNHWPTPQCN